MRSLLSAGLVLVLAVSPAFAREKSPFPKGTQVMLCRFPVIDFHKVIPEGVFVGVFPSGEVQVVDPVSMEFVHAPVPAVVDTDNAVRTTWKWSLGTVGAKAGGDDYAPDMDFKLTMKKADRSARIVIYPAGYRDEQADGSCSAWQTP